MQKYNYIIAGTGAAGLLLAYEMAQDTYFDQKKILLIDKEVKNVNDRTWCFWEKEEGPWDMLMTKIWPKIYFGSPGFSEKIDIHPYRYKMMRSKEFYAYVLARIQEKTNMDYVQEKVLGYKDEGTRVVVETDKGSYMGAQLFSSILQSDRYKQQQKYPLLNQHFIGWFIKTEQEIFDVEVASFMDFTVAQKGNTRFMYVLPISKKEALFEYTLFSENVLEDQEYEDEIECYLAEKGIAEYEITEKERGCIPMTSFRFRNHNSKNVLHIGTAGGWTKASTGFTFKNSVKKTQKLVAHLKHSKDLTKFDPKTKFWFYDLLFLDVLYQQNEIGAWLFSELFRKNKTQTILKFLDEETTFLEDLKIMSSMPSAKFLKMILMRLM